MNSSIDPEEARRLAEIAVRGGNRVSGLAKAILEADPPWDVVVGFVERRVAPHAAMKLLSNYDDSRPRPPWFHSACRQALHDYLLSVRQDNIDWPVVRRLVVKLRYGVADLTGQACREALKRDTWGWNRRCALDVARLALFGWISSKERNAQQVEDAALLDRSLWLSNARSEIEVALECVARPRPLLLKKLAHERIRKRVERVAKRGKRNAPDLSDMAARILELAREDS